MVESRKLWTLKPRLWTSQIWTLINNFVVVLVCEKYPKLITLEENIITVQQLPPCLPLLFAFSFEVLKNVIESCFDEVVLQDAICEECFSMRVFTCSFCYCFYEDFIHKIILVSQFLPFICISYPLKVFKFDTGMLRDSFAVALLQKFRRLPQSIAFLCLILFACNDFPFRAFVTMIYWKSTEMLLNLVGPLNSVVPSLDF